MRKWIYYCGSWASLIGLGEALSHQLRRGAQVGIFQGVQRFALACVLAQWQKLHDEYYERTKR